MSGSAQHRKWSFCVFFFFPFFSSSLVDKHVGNDCLKRMVRRTRRNMLPEPEYAYRQSPHPCRKHGAARIQTCCRSHYQQRRDQSGCASLVEGAADPHTSRKKPDSPELRRRRPPLKTWEYAGSGIECGGSGDVKWIQRECVALRNGKSYTPNGQDRRHGPFPLLFFRVLPSRIMFTSENVLPMKDHPSSPAFVQVRGSSSIEVRGQGFEEPSRE